jgi:N-acyl-D-amino-acid deacylase
VRAWLALAALLCAALMAGAQEHPDTEQPVGGPVDISRFDMVMEGVLTRWAVPGGALVLARDGQIVLARGYGWARVDRRLPFLPTTPLCLASVSKSITAAGILRLVDLGRLRLDDRLYDVLGRPRLPARPADERIYQITVRQLLHHSGGWEREVVYDRRLLNSLARKGPVPFEKLLLVALTRPLDYAPGTEAHYSNFQYAVLKEVVGHASGRPYADFIQAEVLRPMGITDAVMEGSHGHYQAGEAWRYDSETWKPFPGGRPAYPLTGDMGSWVASARDMALFLTAMDGSRMKFLSPESQQSMLAPPPPPLPERPNGTWFGLGWDRVYFENGRPGFSKNGAVAGVHTLVEHLPSGVDFVIFLNGSGLSQEGPPRALAAAARQVRGTIRALWP